MKRLAGSFVFGRFALLYAVLFAAFGVVSPFLAAFLGSRGLSAEAIGLVLAAGTAIRLAAGPLFGGLADRLAAPRGIMVGCAAAACGTAFLYLRGVGLWALLAVTLAQAAALAPITAIADALVLAASAKGGFEYGWVRGVGSGAFIVGTLVAGQAVGRFGLSAVIWLNGLLLGVAVCAGTLVPDRLGQDRLGLGQSVRSTGSGWPGGLLRLPSFGRMMLVAALIQGSHAMHDGFAVIRWRSLGISDATIGVLWSESVAAEVVVFLLLGPWLLRRLGAGGASVLAGLAGVVRWGVLAMSGSVLAAALVEPLHGLTFALQHLACMRLIAAVVPPEMAATAQAFYGTVVVGAATAGLMLASGVLYAQMGAAGFWVMAGLCAVALPVAAGLRDGAGPGGAGQDGAGPDGAGQDGAGHWRDHAETA